MSDLVNHPAHYEEQSIRLEPIDFCERLPFCEGNALKYCFRAGHKEGSSELLDLKKAQWYLNRFRFTRTALKISEEETKRFATLVDYLARTGGVLGEAVGSYVKARKTNYYDFWILLDGFVRDRIKVLETDKALYDQTIGEEK